jgi:NAD(P)H-dependent FMN reductase
MIDEKAQPLHVVAICGSLRKGSHTRQALALALEGARSLGATTELIELGPLKLPFVDGTDGDCENDAGVQSLRQKVRKAKGILLGTPEYHNGYSGVLKNALDLMGFEEFEGKMVGLVGVSGGALGASSAMNGLRDVCRALHAWVVPEQCGVPRASRAFTPEGQAVEERIGRRLRDVGRQVAQYAALHSSRRFEEFLEQMARAEPNPGGEGR